MRDSAHLHLPLQAVFSWRQIVLAILVVLAISGTLRAQCPAPVGTVSGIPPADPTTFAFSTSLRYDSSGDLYAWDGLSVWEESGGTGAFNKIGSLPGGNTADAGPISFSQDGRTLLLSNGAGGYPPSDYTGPIYNGNFWTMAASGGTIAPAAGNPVPYTFDTVALPSALSIPGSSTKYIVYEGSSSYNSSSLSIFDSSTGSNTVVIDDSPGATTSIAVNSKDNRVCVGVVDPTSYLNSIYSFSLSQIDSAFNSGTPIDFVSAGTPFNNTGLGSQSGVGMFFDKNGFLFSGGDGITVFRPDGSICYDQASSAYPALTYNPADNTVLAVAFESTSGTLYNANDFEAGTWIAAGGTTGRWGDAGNWTLATVPSGTATVTFPDTLSAPFTVTLDGSQSAAGLVFDVSGTNGYTLSQGTGGGALTLGTSDGASISVVSGSHTISAPVVLAGSLAVNTWAGSSLDISGSISQAEGVTAALTFSGEGELILSGSNSYSGGTTVSGGTLDVLDSAALPEGSALIVGIDAASIFGEPLASAPLFSQNSPSTVPEPGMLALLAAGGVGFVAVRLLRRRRVE